MINLVIIDEREDENNLIRIVVEKSIHRIIGNERFEYMHLKADDISEFISNNTEIDFCCYDVSGGMESLYKIRKSYPRMSLLLVVETTMSPNEYLKPGIKPDAILIRPMCIEDVDDTISAFLAEGISQKKNDDQTFVVEGREGKYSIPYSKIYFFESRDKKIYLKTIEAEYGFYGTIDELEDELSELFVRCHRSYLVNKIHIREIMNASTILLLNGFVVPISRTYRQNIKELL